MSEQLKGIFEKLQTIIEEQFRECGDNREKLAKKIDEEIQKATTFKLALGLMQSETVSNITIYSHEYDSSEQHEYDNEGHEVSFKISLIDLDTKENKIEAIIKIDEDMQSRVTNINWFTRNLTEDELLELAAHMIGQ